ncbi:MAG: hypothetical protein V2A70_02280, partial [Candidatus Omnitrophota bacterium]
MRMFLIGMTDIFLILYLTSIASVQTTSFLTVNDFYKLTAMHVTLQSDKKMSEQNLQDQLRQAKEEKVDLVVKLAKTQAREKETEKSLLSSKTKLTQIDMDLRLKENLLKEKEQSVTELDRRIKDKEAFYEKELQNQKSAVDASRLLAQKLKLQTQEAEHMADQMKSKADQAYKMAEAAKAIQQSAILLKDAAVKKREEAEQKAREALEARKRAEAEKEAALK